MPTEIEIVGKREIPGLDKNAPRTVHTVVFYRPVGDAARADHVILPKPNATDAEIQAAISTKERGKGDGSAKRITIS